MSAGIVNGFAAWQHERHEHRRPQGRRSDDGDLDSARRPARPKPDPSIGDLVKDATAQVSTLLRAEVELAKAEITRDVKKGLTGSVFFIAALVVLFYSTFFFFFFLAELLDTWLWRWVAFLIVFGLMVLTTGALAVFGFLKVRRIKGPQQTIESVKETREALTPGHHESAVPAVQAKPATDPSGW